MRLGQRLIVLPKTPRCAIRKVGRRGDRANGRRARSGEITAPPYTARPTWRAALFIEPPHVGRSLDVSGHANERQVGPGYGYQPTYWMAPPRWLGALRRPKRRREQGRVCCCLRRASSRPAASASRRWSIGGKRAGPRAWPLAPLAPRRACRRYCRRMVAVGRPKLAGKRAQRSRREAVERHRRQRLAFLKSPAGRQAPAGLSMKQGRVIARRGGDLSSVRFGILIADCRNVLGSCRRGARRLRLPATLKRKRRERGTKVGLSRSSGRIARACQRDRRRV